MLDRSGFGWNDVKMCVEVDIPEVAELLHKQNPKAKYQNGHPFPEYFKILEIFWKDHAKGDASELLGGKFEQIVGSATPGSTPGTTPVTTSATTTGSDGATIGVGIAATEVTASDTATTLVKGKKRMKDSEVFANYVLGMDKRWEQEREDTAKIFEIVTEDVKKRKVDDNCVYAKIHDEMVRLGLDDKVIVDAMFNLPRNTEYIHIFWAMDEGKRVRLAHKLGNMEL
ncbi:hypothetical protein Tsubulata_002460 [Turnera subulata]|uniref:Myb/SANT-like domain-containing protein n=1 Tax=Turnera subulata TaxID=218843 RepID=A0A9Q0J490_9ROSI|nr:hypothetical protein Tsubulata_002460 [Turnera subulata]